MRIDGPGRTPRPVRTGRTDARVKALATVAGLTLFLLPVTTSAEKATLKVLGVMPLALRAPYDLNDNVNTPLRLIVDPGVHRGFLLVNEAGGKHNIVVYDLQSLRRAATIPWPLEALDPNVASTVDPGKHRLFLATITGGGGTAPSLDCDQGTTVLTIDTRRLIAKSATLPCVDGMPFGIEGLSYHEDSNKLYAVGAPVPERTVFYESGLDPFKQRTFYVQIDPETLAIDWVADATQVCDWHVTAGGSIVARYRDDLVSFCYRGGNAYNFGGARGVAVVMPIASVASGGTPRFRTSPTFTDNVDPVIDPVTGRLLLRSETPPYGPAVWGYDPFEDRFFGVAPAGEVYGPVDDRFNGFDPVSGRLYVVNPKGTALIDARGDVLPGGVSFPVLERMRGGSETGGSYTHEIVVDGGIRRLFVAYPKKKGFIVVQDDFPAPGEAVPTDPDQGTADVAEVSGVTSSAFSGAAGAFGMHVINVGGVPGAINNYDQTCFDPSTGLPSPRNLDPNGRCLADQLFTPGNREFFVAQTGLELGSESGVAAFATGLRVPPTDSATDADYRSVAECFVGRLPEPVPGSLRDPIGAFCRDLSPLGMFANGARDAEGRDAPFPGAMCVDETGKYAEETVPTRLGTSVARCDRKGNTGAATADAGIVPPELRPVLSIAEASSTVQAARTSAGIVTTVTATVSGIKIAGVVTIGRVYTEAVTKARGRTGTTSATFKRVISDVHGPGFDCAATCDPQAIVDAFNAAFSTQARARTPSPLTLASPHGFQGIVVKDPRLRASDIAILNDDTDTFNGLDLVLNNDGLNLSTGGPNARSRLVIGLAGVRAESRYGIFPVPAGGGGVDVPGVTVVPPGPPVPPLVLPPVPPPPAPGPQKGPPVARIVSDTWRLIVNHPGQAALLAALLALLASPVYLGMRSRSLARSLGAGS
jgi:hypothetical protein